MRSWLQKIISMCGISGFIIKKANNHIDLNVLKKMVSKLSHRGPDNKGFWKNDNNTQFIGHSRLSILDLSERQSTDEILFRKICNLLQW